MVQQAVLEIDFELPVAGISNAAQFNVVQVKAGRYYGHGLPWTAQCDQASLIGQKTRTYICRVSGI